MLCSVVFLRANARSQFRESSAWRAEQDVEEIMRSHAGIPEDPRIRRAMSAFYSTVLTKESTRTHAGGPVMLELCGSVDLTGIARENMIDDLCKCYTYYVETVWRAVRSIGGRTRATCIVDVKGASYGHVRHVGIIKRFATIGSLNYPEVIEIGRAHV